MQMRPIASEENPMNIDDTVLVADGAKIVGEDLTIGAHSSVWYNAVIRSDDGEHVHIGEKTTSVKYNKSVR